MNTFGSIATGGFVNSALAQYERYRDAVERMTEQLGVNSALATISEGPQSSVRSAMFIESGRKGPKAPAGRHVALTCRS